MIRTSPEAGPGHFTWMVLFVTLGCAVFASGDRLLQYSAWSQSQGVGGEQPQAMATLDAYYSLRWAEDARDGAFLAHAPDPLRVFQRRQYPEGTRYWERTEDALEWLPQLQPKSLPLLSRLIAFASRLSGLSVDAVGILLPALLSGVFMLPLVLYCARLGLASAGIMAALITAFSPAYYRRSVAGWVDTDMLNLFFPWLIALVILHCGRATSPVRQLLLAAAAGLCMHGWYLWYPKPALSIFFLLSLFLYLRCQRIAWTTVLQCCAIFVLAANPLQLLEATPDLVFKLDRYLGDTAASAATGEQAFPSALATVSEMARLSWTGVCEATTGSVYAGILGLLTTAVLLALRWRQAIPLLPVLALGMLSFVSSGRFTMYLAPFAGLGLGVFVHLVTRSFAAAWRGTQRRQASASGAEALEMGVILLCFAVLFAPASALGTSYRSALPTAIPSGLQDLGRILPEDARLWTWWDTGFTIAYVARRAVYHDGGAQYTPLTYFVARSFVDDDQQSLANTIRMIDGGGNRRLDELYAELGSRAAVVREVTGQAWPQAHPHLHVVFTADMIAKYAAMSYLGSWDFQSGGRPAEGLALLSCTDRRGSKLSCAEGTFNLESGHMDGGVQLGRVVFIERGHVVFEREFLPPGEGPVLQLLISEHTPYAVYLLSEGAYRSNFNQMYLLGRHDPELFEEVYNAFPAVRAFRLRQP